MKQHSDYDILDAIGHAIINYNSFVMVEQCEVDKLTVVTYSVIGQGAILSEIIGVVMSGIAPNKEYNIHNIPSERKLVFTLL